MRNRHQLQGMCFSPHTFYTYMYPHLCGYIYIYYNIYIYIFLFVHTSIDYKLLIILVRNEISNLRALECVKTWQNPRFGKAHEHMESAKNCRSFMAMQFWLICISCAQRCLWTFFLLLLYIQRFHAGEGNGPKI